MKVGRQAIEDSVHLSAATMRTQSTVDYTFLACSNFFAFYRSVFEATGTNHESEAREEQRWVSPDDRLKAVELLKRGEERVICMNLKWIEVGRELAGLSDHAEAFRGKVE